MTNTIFAAAADVIEQVGWTQHRMQDATGAVCLTAALAKTSFQPGERLIAQAVARRRGHGEDWNDDNSTTKAQVLDWLRTTDPIRSEELAQMFGPQHEAICALVLRAASLTTDDISRLCAAQVATRAWDVARNTA